MSFLRFRPQQIRTLASRFASSHASLAHVSPAAGKYSLLSSSNPTRCFSSNVSLWNQNNPGNGETLSADDINNPNGTYSKPGSSSTIENHSQCLLKIDENNPGVAYIVFNRIKQRNAFSRQFIEELNRNLDWIQQNSQHIRVVIFKSADSSIFCAGADLKERAQMTQQEASFFVSKLRSTMDRIEQLQQPTIAMVAGGAFGGGLELALACDMRLACEKTSMGLVETSLAIIPGAGGTQRLPRIIGMSKAKELIYTARRFNGEYAEKIGLANYVLDSAEKMDVKALELAKEIAKNGPVAVRVAKIAIQNGIEVDRQSGMFLEQQCYAQVIPTKDRIEGLTAFKEKRKPQYKGE